MKTVMDRIDILLVEDSPTDVMIATEALRNAKVLNNLYVVDNGVDALDFLYKRGKHTDAPRPDLILLDLNLPRKSGLEVLAEIKQDPNLKAIPIVVLTTSEDEKDVVRSYKLHANCYVTKPVDFERFTEVVREVRNFWFAIVTLPPENGR
jgi:two-component system, chemotaxis family, response regulator Rcp1